MYAIISDLHSNEPALRAVSEHIKSQGIDDIVCLGDVVGYGASPVFCIDFVINNCRFSMKGNHDFATIASPIGFNPRAKAASEWQKKQLKPSVFSFSSTKARWKFLEQMPERKECEEEFGKALYVHGSPRDPISEYIEACECLDVGFGPGEKIKENMELIEHVCFVGHTHSPGVITGSPVRFITPCETGMLYTIRENEKAIINVGSVGQPRDKDSRACYVTVDNNEVKWHRVEYDIASAKKAIYKVSELDNQLGDRLELGT